MMPILDPKAGGYLWRCPKCGETIRLSSQAAVCLAKRTGCCQGCRARVTFEQNPGLVGFFLDFWARTDAWPQSASWMDAIPTSGVSILGNSHSSIGMLRKRGSSAATWAA
jgi:hypothetical protein